MASSTATQSSVLLAHGPLDRGMARLVQATLTHAGIVVHAVDHLECDEGYLSDLRRLVSECSAVIILLTRSTLNSQDVPFEIGMALAWERPVYLLYDGIDCSGIPAFLREYRIRPLTSLAVVVRELAACLHPTSG